MEATLLHMSIATLRKLLENLHSTTKNEQVKIDFLAKYIFVQDLADIENMNSAMKLVDAAIRAITTIKFYDNYLDKHGRLSWDSYKDNLEKAVSVFLVVSICVHLCKWTRVSISIANCNGTRAHISIISYVDNSKVVATRSASSRN